MLVFRLGLGCLTTDDEPGREIPYTTGASGTQGLRAPSSGRSKSVHVVDLWRLLALSAHVNHSVSSSQDPDAHGSGPLDAGLAHGACRCNFQTGMQNLSQTQGFKETT